MRFFVTLALAVALCVSAAPLHAQGLLVVQKTVIGTTVGTSRAQIEHNRMRTEIDGIANTRQVVIFDGVKQTMTTMNLDQKTYTVVTKAEMAALQSQAADGLARQQEMIARMPPEQRARIEALMKGRGAPGAPAAAAVKTQFRKTGTDKVGSWTCDKYEGYQGTQKVADLCTVDPRALGFVPADFEIAKQMAEFTGSASATVTPFAPGTVEVQGFAGVPVKRIEYANGQPRFSFEFVSITRQSFPASSYDIPAGFQKVESPMGAMGRGRVPAPK